MGYENFSDYIPSKSEKSWIKRFKKIISSMPDSLELDCVHRGIHVCQSGENDRTFERDGHCDNVPYIDSVRHDNIYPNSESM